MIKFEDAVVLKPIASRGETKWQASYKNTVMVSYDKYAAVRMLKQSLETRTIALPPSPDIGSIRIVIAPNSPIESCVAAENLPYMALGPTDESAEANLRFLCKELGVPCPERVYNVAKTIATWMN